MSLVSSEMSKDIQKEANEAKNCVKSDYEFARRNLIRIIEDGMQLVPDACETAREAETPRQFEALSIFLKTMADINKDLIDRGEKRIKIDSSSTPAADGKNIINQTNQTAVFCGSTEDLFNRLFENKLENQP
jgi:hypothetical protein